LTLSFVLQASFVWNACVVSLPWEKAEDPDLCHTSNNAPFALAFLGLAVIAAPILASWLGYVPRWRGLLAHGTRIAWVTWILTVVLIVLAGTGLLGEPPCLAVSSPV
jgi:hypothetical protein